ncbi:MAG: zf-HC2 domain-containing protein [Blastocatellia bacterium]
MQTWLRGGASHAAQACPAEADILKYTEDKLSPPSRARLDRHFAACHDCRELLVLLARFPEEDLAQPPLSTTEIQQQTARVLQYIDADDRSKAAHATDNGLVAAPQRGWGFRYRAGLTVAGLLIGALMIGGLYLITRREPATESARQSLALAMKDERRSAARFSGGFAPSPYVARRGTDDSPDLQLRVAVGQLKAAESESAPVEMRQMLARAHLAFDRADHARQALTILESLSARGIETAELFNDLGVAQFQLQSYDAAIASFDQALSLNSNYSEALFNRALAEESAARYAEARRDWEQFINSISDAKWKAEAEQHLAGLSNYSR